MLQRVDRTSAAQAHGVVIVIDVIHAVLQRLRRGDPDFPIEDVPVVLSVNRFNFAMVGQQQEWQGISYVEIKRVPIES